MYIHVSDSCQVWQKSNLLLFETGGIRAASESVPPEYTAHRQVFLTKNLLLLETTDILVRIEIDIRVNPWTRVSAQPKHRYSDRMSVVPYSIEFFL